MHATRVADRPGGGSCGAAGNSIIEADHQMSFALKSPRAGVLGDRLDDDLSQPGGEIPR